MDVLAMAEQGQALAPLETPTASWIAVAVPLVAAMGLLWLQRSRNLRWAHSKFSRNLFAHYSLLVCTSLAALALLPTHPDFYMAFVFSVASFAAGRLSTQSNPFDNTPGGAAGPPAI